MKIFHFKKQRAFPLAIVAVAAISIVFATGCAAHHAYLVPAPNDNLANGGHAARASADNVSVSVFPNDWTGRPHDLYLRVTPLKVRIENHSSQPLRIVYNDFRLETSNGKMLAALPPSEIRGTQYVGQNDPPSPPRIVNAAWQDKDHDQDHATRVIITPGFDYNDFYYAPYWNYGYLGLTPWPYEWAPDMGYYNAYYPYMRAIHLPTHAMLRKAIPEGVVGPGGYVEGFLYFSKVNPDLKDVVFIASLQNAKTGQDFGTVRIPFVVKNK